MDKNVVILLLLGGGLWFATRGTSSFAGLGDDEPVPPAPLDPATVPNRRFLSRKFYGTFVLAQQSAASLEKAGKRMPLPVQQSAEAMQSSMREWVDSALGQTEVPDREAVVSVLEAVLLAGLVSLVMGANSPADIGDDLERATRLLLSA